MKGARVPVVARWLVSRLANEGDREFVLADLAEGFEARNVRDGAGRAKRWYRWQVIRAMPALVRARLDGGVSPVRVAVLPDARPGLARGIRLMRRRPLYAGSIVLTLGLGLGSAGAVFAVARGVWFRPLSHAGSDRIVRLHEVNLRPAGSAVDADRRAVLLSQPERWSAVSPPIVDDLERAGLSSLESVAAMVVNEFDWTDTDGARRVSALTATAGAFDVLGVRLLLGRAYGRGAVQEVVLTEPFWRSAFGADASAIGRSMDLDGVPQRIVGVVRVPAGYPQETDIWAPLTFDAESLTEGMRGARYLEVAGRLKPGATVQQAAAEVDATIAAAGEIHPNNRDWGAAVVPLRDELIRPYAGILMLLLAAGAAFLLLAVVNVAGLVASKRADEGVERSIRIALGASRGTVLMEGVSECVPFALAASVVAVIGTNAVLAPLKRLAPAGIPRLADVGVDAATVALLLLGGLVSGLTAGLVGHAMSGARYRPAVGRGPQAAGSGLRGRRILLSVQLGLSVWLLVSGVAMTRRIMQLRASDPGFRPEDVLVAPLSLNAKRYATDAQQRIVWMNVIDGLAARGIDAAIGTNPPISGSTMHFGFTIEGEPDMQFSEYHSVSARYFDVLGIGTIAGRTFTAEDRDGGAPVVIVSDNIARQFFADGQAVGRELTLVGERRLIVGVVSSTRHAGPDRPAPMEVYVPIEQDPWPFGHLLIRGRDAAVAGSHVNAVMSAIDGAIPVPPLSPFANYVSRWFAPFRFQFVILGLLASIGTILAALGVHALVAYFVTSRNRDIGIRLALGADRRRIVGLVVVQAVSLAMIGTIAGFVAAYATRTVASRFVPGLDATNPAVLAAVVAIVAAASLVAAFVPARRAARCDPAVALRSD